ncbi:MAG: hypothetical protein NTX86_02330 [Candidatus Dependentiae bacterium]|nr:hypothetical protein [Candidatus Dependentiae bacterium]
MRFRMDFSKLPRCGAKPKVNSARTLPCRHVALKNGNGRCYYHAGRPLKHGLYTKKSYNERTVQRCLINDLRHTAESLKEFIKSQKEVK